MYIIWTALDVRPQWGWIIIVGIFALLSVFVFRFSLGAYHRRYFFDKAIKLAFWRTVGWLVLYGGSFAVIFALILLIFPENNWLRYLIGSFVWWLVSSTLLTAVMRFLDSIIEKW